MLLYAATGPVAHCACLVQGMDVPFRCMVAFEWSQYGIICLLLQQIHLVGVIRSTGEWSKVRILCSHGQLPQLGRGSPERAPSRLLRLVATSALGGPKQTMTVQLVWIRCKHYTTSRGCHCQKGLLHSRRKICLHESSRPSDKLMLVCQSAFREIRRQP